MNRVIKFRAWDDNLKKMHKDVNPFRWDFVISNSWHRCEKSTGSGILGSGGDTAEMLVPAVRYTHLMQFTGLTDRNGTEIYEGDILGDSYQSIGVVIWNSDSASFLINYTDDLQNIEEGDLSWAEVIGNIHQNPELLNP